jgi:pimeloyl-ACP methyl ester carboxylesterase
MSKPKLYALHVGINNYPKDTGISSLSGCINDAKMLCDFIQQQYSGEYEIHTQNLFDSEATYASIIKHFGPAHLGKAVKGDIAFFSYSGHGAKEQSAPEFKDPGGMCETLVCYDSRPSGMDLADKELAVLAHLLELQGAYVITMLDCCHSGSGFRGDEAVLGKARQCYDRSTMRPLSDYISGYYAQLRDQGKPITVPNPKQLNLAACDRSEKAYEYGSNGLFTLCLLQVLKDTPRISYAKLFDRTRTKMQDIADKQTPRFEPSNSFDSYELFLRPGNTAEEIRSTLNYKDNKWKVNLGHLHGVPQSANQKAVFAVYKNGEPTPFTSVNAITVGFQDTEVDFDGVITDEYDAKLISMPDSVINVLASPSLLDRLESLQLDHPTLKPVNATLTTDANGTSYKLDFSLNQISILRLDDTLVKCYTITEQKEEYLQFRAAIDDIDHIAKWERFLALDKSNTILNDQKCKLELLLEDSAGMEIAVTNAGCIEMYGQNGNFPDLPFRLKLNNPSNRDLHYAVFYLTQDYSVSILSESKIIPVGVNQEVFSSKFELAPRTYEELFHVKVVVSTDYIESQTLEQKKLDSIRGIKDDEESMEKEIQTKGIKKPSDWFTKTLSIRLVGIDQQLSDNIALSLADNTIIILPNPILQAKVNVITGSREKSRGDDILSTLPRLLDEELVSFISGPSLRGGSDPLVLNLEEIKGAEKIAVHPLQIEVRQSLKSNERLLPVTFDGDKVVLLGYSETQADGSVLVTVNHLPDKQPLAGTRSVGKAVWLYLVKVTGIDTHMLRYAYREGNKVKRSTSGLITKVSEAKKILLVIHGIFGDTRDMARFGLEATDKGRYDLILTFDYENLNTPIDQTAAILRDELVNVGLVAGHGKELTILAHSMGGLVARWYIENLGGKESVGHLVMAGTPNLGSNFGRLTEYIAWGSKLLGLAGAFKLSIPFAAPILGFLGGLQALTETLAQMNYNDPGRFLISLEENSDPGIQYSILAGSMDGFLANEQSIDLSEKVLDTIATLFNGRRDNDIAVEISSIHGISNARRPMPKLLTVPCHHMNYFIHPESVKALHDYLDVT